MREIAVFCGKVLACLIVIAMLRFGTGCTANQRAREYGGTETINLPANIKLVNVTWKDANIWYLTRPMREGEVPETLTFQEQSSLGLVEGTVIFEESK